MSEIIYVDYTEDGSLNGFYSTAVHSEIPETAVAISRDMWNYLLENQGRYRLDPDMIQVRLQQAPGSENIHVVDSEDFFVELPMAPADTEPDMITQLQLALAELYEEVLGNG